MSNKLYRYCIVNDYSIQNLERNQLYFNYAKLLNDPYEGAFDFKIRTNELTDELLRVFYEHRYEELINCEKDLNVLLDHTRFSMMTQFLHEMRLICFSSYNDSLLMWGHYANSHKGICIEYKTNDPIFYSIEKVRYKSEIPKLEINSLDDLNHERLTKQFINIFSTKEANWKYENEFRLFDITGTGVYKLIPDSISSIYMGLFCSEEDEEKIRKALLNQNVRFYRTKLNSLRYKIEFYEV